MKEQQIFTWHIVTIGHLSRNRFWGEDEGRAYREPLATCTLLQGGGLNIVIDPSLPQEKMQKALMDCAGIRPEQVTHTFSTHYHGDHHWDLSAFPNAVCCMPEKDLETIRKEQDAVQKSWGYLKNEQLLRLVPAEENLVPGLEMIPLAGHTEGLSGYLFHGPEGKILCTGDCVMTREFFRAGQSYFFGWDIEENMRSIRRLKTPEGIPDIMIPGHGEPFQARIFRE